MGQLIGTWRPRDEGKTRETVSSDPKLNRHISFSNGGANELAQLRYHLASSGI